MTSTISCIKKAVDEASGAEEKNDFDFTASNADGRTVYCLEMRVESTLSGGFKYLPSETLALVGTILSDLMMVWNAPPRQQ